MLDQGYFDKVYYQFWKTDNATSNVFAIHGLGGHCLWFENAANTFNKNKINFFSFDLPGFGQSKYPKGVVSSYKEWIQVSKKTLEDFLLNFNIKEPVFILGHSMGSLIAVLLSKNVKAHGWILSVPGFEGYRKTWPLVDFVLPVLIRSTLRSKENVALPFGPELLTKNKQTQLLVKQDPLRVINIQTKTFLDVYSLALKAKRSSFFLEEPVLILQAGKDMVCSNSAMDAFFEKIKSIDKVKIMYENSYHDLFLEDEIHQIADDISEWIKKRT